MSKYQKLSGAELEAIATMNRFSCQANSYNWAAIAEAIDNHDVPSLGEPAAQWPASGERRNLETRPKVTIVLDERGEPVELSLGKPRGGPIIASAPLDFGMGKEMNKALSEDADKLEALTGECHAYPLNDAVAEDSNAGKQFQRLTDTTYGDDQILKANS